MGVIYVLDISNSLLGTNTNHYTCIIVMYEIQNSLTNIPDTFIF